MTEERSGPQLIPRDPDPSQTGQRLEGEQADARLLQGLIRNDRGAMVAAYDSYGALAYGVACKTLGQSSEAEDVVQEAFLALWRQAGRLDPARGVRSYLLTIVHNKAIDRLRKRSRRPELQLDEALPVPAEGADPVEYAEAMADRDLVRSAMSGLPEEQRRTVEMAYFGGLTTSEVAAEMRIPVGTVKSRLRLALGHMRRALVGSG
jgi:RNA polymerase sigma-70 factor (ECF subfamily)